MQRPLGGGEKRNWHFGGVDVKMHCRKELGRGAGCVGTCTRMQCCVLLAAPVWVSILSDFDFHSQVQAFIFLEFALRNGFCVTC